MDIENTDYRWYLKRSPHEQVFNYINYLDQNQGYRQLENLRHMRLYGNAEFIGSLQQNFFRVEQSYSVQHRVTLNVIGSMIDTAASKITKNKPRPYFLTDGADWSLKRKGEKLTKFIDGVFYGCDFYSKTAMAFKDSAIFGTGCIKIFSQNGAVKAERVFIDEIRVDDTECLYGEPLQMHQQKWIHKEVLKATFPSSASAIEIATSPLNPNNSYTTSATKGDMLLVIESWKKPSGGKVKGKHTICIQNETLFEEEWDKDYFPFIFFRWNQKSIGFFGQGIAEQLTGLQLEINKILRTIQVSMHLVSVPKIFVEASSKIVSAHLNNKIGGIIKYAGQPPTEGALGTVPAELFSHLDRLYSRAYEIVGISQLSAQSEKPPGIDSGKALRTLNDVQAERFNCVQKDYESQFIHASKIMVDLIKQIAEETKDFSIKVPGKKFLETINWADVQLEDDQYMLQIFPTSALSQEPSARFQEVQELLQAGFIAKEDGLKLLDYPDLQSYYNMANAGVEDIERQIELMVEKGEYQTPEPYQNLQYGITKMQQAYLMYRQDGAPEEMLDLFRRWIEDAKELMDKASQEAQNMQAQAQAAVQPQAVPQAPPQSDLLPNAPAPK